MTKSKQVENSKISTGNRRSLKIDKQQREKYSSELSVDVNIYSTMKPKHNKSQEQT